MQMQPPIYRLCKMISSDRLDWALYHSDCAAEDLWYNGGTIYNKPRNMTLHNDDR